MSLLKQLRSYAELLVFGHQAAASEASEPSVARHLSFSPAVPKTGHATTVWQQPAPAPTAPAAAAAGGQGEAAQRPQAQETALIRNVHSCDTPASVTCGTSSPPSAMDISACGELPSTGDAGAVTGRKRKPGDMQPDHSAQGHPDSSAWPSEGGFPPTRKRQALRLAPGTMSPFYPPTGSTLQQSPMWLGYSSPVVKSRRKLSLNGAGGSYSGGVQKQRTRPLARMGRRDTSLPLWVRSQQSIPRKVPLAHVIRPTAKTATTNSPGDLEMEADFDLVFPDDAPTPALSAPAAPIPELSVGGAKVTDCSKPGATGKAPRDSGKPRGEEGSGRKVAAGEVAPDGAMPKSSVPAAGEPQDIAGPGSAPAFAFGGSESTTALAAPSAEGSGKEASQEKPAGTNKPPIAPTFTFGGSKPAAPAAAAGAEAAAVALAAIPAATPVFPHPAAATSSSQPAFSFGPSGGSQLSAPFTFGGAQNTAGAAPFAFGARRNPTAPGASLPITFGAGGGGGSAPAAPPPGFGAAAQAAVAGGFTLGSAVNPPAGRRVLKARRRPH